MRSFCAVFDADPEVRLQGRSVFIRSAVEMYLGARQRREIDEQLKSACAGHADELLTEVGDLVGAQEGRESESRPGACAVEVSRQRTSNPTVRSREIQRRQPPRSQRCEESSAAQFAHSRAVRSSPFPPLRFWR